MWFWCLQICTSSVKWAEKDSRIHWHQCLSLICFHSDHDEKQYLYFFISTEQLCISILDYRRGLKTLLNENTFLKKILVSSGPPGPANPAWP